MNLPINLLSYKEKIEQTLKPVVHIELKQFPSDLQEHYYSKVGGHPYWPIGMNYPLAADGTPLRLLAQINFSHMAPKLENYPTQGMLQFFVHPFDETFGSDYLEGTKQENFRIVYHEEILYPEELQQTFSPFEKTQPYPLMDFEKSYQMELTVTKDPISTIDYRFYEALGIDFDDYDFIDTYYENVTREGHKIGGYADFIQTDPRSEGQFLDKTELLFQMDSDEDFGIMWQDVGVGIFLISKEDLQNLKFDDVVFYWDSH